MMSESIASRVGLSRQPVVPRILDQARKLEAEGKSLIYLLRGKPDFDTPKHISDAAINAIRTGETHYPPTRGIPALRQAVADRMQRDFNLVLDSDEEVLITTGATMGIYLALMAIIDPGDEVILFNPVYDPYLAVVAMAGGVPIQLHAKDKKGHFYVASEMLERALTTRSKAIIINNPWNPTGTVMKRDELERVCDIAAAHGLVIISDEIYENIIFDDHKHHPITSISKNSREQSVLINSFSKTYAMTGWRLGYNIAPPQLTHAMHKISAQFSRSASTFIQHGGIAALNGPQDASDMMISTYTSRREMLINRLSDAGVASFYPPEGTFFLFIDIRPFGMKSEEMTEYLMKIGQVVTVPGSAYGTAGEGFIRLSFAYSTESLQEGVEALVTSLQTL